MSVPRGGMDSDYDDYDDYDDELYEDSGNESPDGEESDGQEDFGMDPGFEDEPAASSSQKIEDEYYYEVNLFPTKFVLILLQHFLCSL